MKKITAVLIGIVLTIGVALTAHGVFTDQNQFDSWYQDAVLMMHTIGVINGYPDGSFKPENNVNRAELAVMFKKYNQYSNDQRDGSIADALFGFMTVQDRLAKLEVPSFYKNLLVMAKMDMRLHKGKPPNLNLYSLLTDVGDLPDGYTIYREGEGLVLYGPHYIVLYEGSKIVEGDIAVDVDEWYGPFYPPRDTSL